jgi:hypothetical protein
MKNMQAMKISALLEVVPNIQDEDNLNYWVMHPVACVSIKYCNNLRTQQSIFSARFYCAICYFVADLYID